MSRLYREIQQEMETRSQNRCTTLCGGSLYPANKVMEEPILKNEEDDHSDDQGDDQVGIITPRIGGVISDKPFYKDDNPFPLAKIRLPPGIDKPFYRPPTSNIGVLVEEYGPEIASLIGEIALEFL